MIRAVALATLRILLFRAGPEDFPYSEQPRLLQACLAIAVLASGLVLGASAPPLAALLAGVFATAALGFYTRFLLRLRQLDARFAQTMGALACCGAVLMLVLRLPVAEVVPLMTEFAEKLKDNPELADDPANWPQIPAGAALTMDFIALWLFAVTAHIYRRATGTGFLLSGGLALLAIMNVLAALFFTAPLLAMLGA